MIESIAPLASLLESVESVARAHSDDRPDGLIVIKPIVLLRLIRQASRKTDSLRLLIRVAAAQEAMIRAAPVASE